MVKNPSFNLNCVLNIFEVISGASWGEGEHFTKQYNYTIKQTTNFYIHSNNFIQQKP